MQKIIFTIPLLILCLPGRSQLYIQSGSGFKTTGDVQITLDSSGITNDDASADFSHCVLWFTNTGVAMLNGNGSWIIKTMVLKKPGSNLQLGAPVQVTYQVQLSAGILDLNNQSLILAPDATIEGENSLTYITGPNGGVVQTTVSLNSPSAENPGKIGAQITCSQNLGSVTIKRWHKPDGGSLGKLLRFYEIIPDRNTSLNATLRLYYLDHELNNNTESSIQLFTRNSAQNTWAVVNSPVKDVSMNYIEKTGVGAFEQYAFGSGNMTPLPLVWGPIIASCKKGNIEVKWSTVQDSGVHNFIVQRSTDGSSWTDLSIVKVIINLNSTKDYVYTDATAPAGANLYYRIVAVEDESFSYSQIASTTGCKKSVAIKLSPVPAITTTNLSVYSEEGCQATIRLLGADGRIYKQRNVTVARGFCRFQFDVTLLSKGTYYLVLELSDGSQQTISFTKQ